MQERITEEIRVALARRKMSASELARRAGWGQGYIARRMDGRAPLSVDDLDRIAEVLDMSINDLIPERTHGRTTERVGSISMN